MPKHKLTSIKTQTIDKNISMPDNPKVKYNIASISGARVIRSANNKLTINIGKQRKKP